MESTSQRADSLTARPGLSQPRSLTRGRAVALTVAAIGFGVFVAVVYAWGKVPLTPVPAASSVHAVAMVIVCGTIAMLLFTHAQATGERGYLILGATFAYVAAVMLLFPMVYPNGVLPSDPPAPLWGTLQSSATLFHPWHLALIFGVTVSAVVLERDQRNGRRPDLGRGPLISVLVVAALFALTAACVIPWIDAFPPVVVGIEATAAALTGFRFEALLALVGTIIVAYECRRGSVISRWLLAVMVVTLGEAVTMLNADRYSLAWYYNRVIGLVAAVILLFVLVRDLGKVERRTKQLLERDPLTGAASRATTLAVLERELRRAQQVGSVVTLLWVNIDGFKEINERVGPQVGDGILEEMYERLRAHTAATDLVGRVGGDEFAIVVPDSTEESATALAARLVKRLAEPFHMRDSVVSLSASLGLAASRDPESGPEELARHALIAMLAAKAAGGDRAEWFDDDLESDAIRRAQLRHALTEAIRQRAFGLEYQPIVSLATGEVIGAEALVGWIRDGQRVSAGHFIRFAEDSGLIVAIGRQVVAGLALDAPEILDRVPEEFMLTFNLSVKELADDAVIDALCNGPLAVHAHRLFVEVTESLEMEGDSRGAANIAVLRERGYRIAIDDFGAGFSNFVQLAELRPAVVKVDRSIVMRAGAGSVSGVATLQASLDVARSFGCRTLAEGLETNDEAEVCVRLGVEFGQGYRYSRSLPLASLLDFWSSRAITSDDSARGPARP